MSELYTIVSKAQQFYIQGKNKREVFTYLLENLLELTESGYGFIGEILYDKNKMPYLKTYAITNIAWTNELRKTYEAKISEGIDFTKLNNLFGLVITENKVIISNDPENDTRRGGKSKIPQGHPPLLSFAGIPFYHQNTIIGMVGLANKKGGYTIESLNTFQIFYDTCSTLISGFRTLDDASRAKAADSKYLSQLSHDMRTPLNAICGYCQLIEMEDGVTPTIQQHLGIINKSSRVLLNMIDDILNVSHLNICVDFTIVNLKQLIKNAIEITKPMCHTNNIKITSKLDEINIESDVKLLENIMINILTNAVKYNITNGTIDISTQIKRNTIEIYIKDSGIGILKKDINSIFQLFFRVDKVSHIMGNGLGLAIVKKNINALQGTVSVTSKIGLGSEFKIVLPYKKSLVTSDILYVEDNLINQSLMRNIMKKYSFTMDIVGTVALGKEMIKNNKYSIYILDEGLPDGCGSSLVKEIDIIDNIIVLTADASTYTQEKIFKMGVNNFFCKPFNISKMIKLIREQISRR